MHVQKSVQQGAADERTEVLNQKKNRTEPQGDAVQCGQVGLAGLGF